MTVAVAAALVAVGASPRHAVAQTGVRRWSVELFGGGALSAPMPLVIRQDGEQRLSFTAHYATRPWRDSPYYMYRVGRWGAGGRRGWELELLHHKAYLERPPSEVQRFEMSHGYNMIFLDRAVRRGRTIVRLGAGAVVAHPESVVRGRSRRGAYILSGAAGQLAASRRFRLTRALFASAEGKITAAWARVPIAGGHAVASNVAGHALLGVGVGF